MGLIATGGVILGNEPPPLTYDQTVLADSPVGFWPLNESSGTTAIDATGNQNGTYSGTFTLGAAALLPDGETSTTFGGGKMSVPDWSGLRLGSGALSVEMWLDATSLPNYATLSDNGQYTVLVQNPTTAYILLGGGLINPNSLSPWISNTATLYYFVLTSTGPSGTYTLYVNGSATHSGSTPANNTNSSTGVTFANGGSGGTGFIGRMAKCAVYNYALTSAKVTTHYAAG